MLPRRDRAHACAVDVGNAGVDWWAGGGDLLGGAEGEAAGEGGEAVEGGVGFLAAFAYAVREHAGVEGRVGCFGEVVSVSKAGAPVAEVGGYDKDVACVGDVGG